VRRLIVCWGLWLWQWASVMLVPSAVTLSRSPSYTTSPQASSIMINSLEASRWSNLVTQKKKWEPYLTLSRIWGPAPTHLRKCGLGPRRGLNYIPKLNLGSLSSRRGGRDGTIVCQCAERVCMYACMYVLSALLSFPPWSSWFLILRWERWKPPLPS